MNGGSPQNLPIAACWIALFDELARWQAAGRRARFWWRDDDAQAPGVALDRLLELSALHQVPLLLAVIPEGLDPSLAAVVAASGAPVAIAQHGIAHANRAPEGVKNTELHDDALADPGFTAALQAGQQALARQFGSSLLPVMVPPWNRIGPGVEAALAGLGYSGLSRDGRSGGGLPGLVEVNTHADLVDWHHDRRFIGAGRALETITQGLADGREAGQDEPVGLLTHHLVHDRALWSFLAQFLGLIAGHPAAAWPRPATLFAP